MLHRDYAKKQNSSSELSPSIELPYSNKIVILNITEFRAWKTVHICKPRMFTKFSSRWSLLWINIEHCTDKCLKQRESHSSSFHWKKKRSTLALSVTRSHVGPVSDNFTAVRARITS